MSASARESAIGVAVVGTGIGQKVHIPGFSDHPRINLVAVCNRNLDKAKAIAQSHDIPNACQTVEEVVNLPEVDAVSVTTPPFLHYDMAKAVLNAGKHLLLEKPTTLNVAEARELCNLADNRNLAAAMHFEYRCVPAWLRLAELLEDGYVGTKRFVKIDWLMQSRANPERAWDWYARKDRGGGALGALGSHSFDYIDWLFGPVARLSAKVSTTIPERPDPADGGQLKPVDSDDTCSLMLEFADGTPGQMSISSATYRGRGHWIEVYGDRATLVLGSDNQKDYVHGFRLWGSEGGEPLSELSIPDRLQFRRAYSDGRIAPFIGVVDRWVEAIETGKPFAPSLTEGVYSQLLMDLTHESSETHSWVKVPSLQEVFGHR
jgi:predicted dehydrogenase